MINKINRITFIIKSTRNYEQMSNDYISVLCTCPDEEIGAAIAHRLVNEHAIACANIIPKIRSIYRWSGNIEDETEVLLIMKTSQVMYNKVESLILEHHPYDTPEVISLNIENGSKQYLDWIDQSLSETGNSP